MRSCLATIADETGGAVKVAVVFRAPFQQFVQHKQGPKVDPHFGELDHEVRRVRKMGEMADWADAEDAEVEEDLVKFLE